MGVENKPYFEALNGVPHFKDEMPKYTHHAIDVLIADGRVIGQLTLDGRELIISATPKEDVKRDKV